MISDPAALTAELSNPETSAHRLVEIAGSFPEFGSLVAEHPNATIDVLSFLLKHGDDVARKAAARRRARDVALITTRQAAPSVVARENSDDQYTVPVRPLPPDAHDADHESRTRPLSAPAASNSDSVSKAAAASESIFRAAPTLAEPEDVDETRIVTRSTATVWNLELEGHGVFAVPHVDLIVGRKPTPLEQFADAVPFPIPDPTKTLSKVHARLFLREGSWYIIDLGATNGVLIETSRGDEQISVGSEVSLAAGFVLGDLRMRMLAEN